MTLLTCSISDDSVNQFSGIFYYSHNEHIVYIFTRWVFVILIALLFQTIDGGHTLLSSFLWALRERVLVLEGKPCECEGGDS